MDDLTELFPEPVGPMTLWIIERHVLKLDGKTYTMIFSCEEASVGVVNPEDMMAN
jgi:hypothetical protein